MSPVSLLPILPILLLALTTVYLVNKVRPIPISKGHYAAIDGIRGYLAFFVFLHHSSIWYFFIRFRYWGAPPSHVYNHFGPTSVALFFMITAFLFFRKLMKARSGTMDWLQLYVSRVCRIMPMYLLAVTALFVIVAIVSCFSLRVPMGYLVMQMLDWLVFMSPDVNGVRLTGLIIAGVIGSLVFEWLFYFSLALIGFLFFKIRTSIIVLICTSCLLLFFAIVIGQYYSHGAMIRLILFSGGIVAAFLVDNPGVRRMATSKLFSILIFVLLIIVIGFYSDVYSFIPLICLIIAFIGIACGNTLFGLLTHTTSRQLGQISYSIFMLHGLLLFLTFRLVLRNAQPSATSAIGHWVVIAVISVVLVLLSSFTYQYIEIPFMNAAPGVASRIENMLKEENKAIKV